VFYLKPIDSLFMFCSYVARPAKGASHGQPHQRNPQDHQGVTR
jgi:hypothetical protein